MARWSHALTCFGGSNLGVALSIVSQAVEFADSRQLGIGQLE